MKYNKPHIHLFRYIFHLDHANVVLLSIIQLAILWFAVLNISFLNPISNAINSFSLNDFVFESLQNDHIKDTCRQITLVDMTELKGRDEIANLITEIDLCNPACIGIDLIFEGEKGDTIANNRLVSAINCASSPLVLAKKLTAYNSELGYFTDEVRSFFPESRIQEAYTNLDCNMTGECIRMLESFEKGKRQDTLLSFSAAIASELGIEPPNNNSLIYYGNTSFPVVSFDQIGSNYDKINGHVVIVGAFQEEQDRHNTPIGKLAGMEIQAYSTLTILEQSGTRVISKWLKWIIDIIISYLFELCLWTVHLLFKKKYNPICTFINSSNVTDMLLLFFFSAIFCWVALVLLVKYHLDIDGGVVLAVMAMVPESRNIYGAMISSLRCANKGKQIVKNTIF